MTTLDDIIDAHTNWEECPDCLGLGQVQAYTPRGLHDPVECPRCFGDGKVWRQLKKDKS